MLVLSGQTVTDGKRPELSDRKLEVIAALESRLGFSREALLENGVAEAGTGFGTQRIQHMSSSFAQASRRTPNCAIADRYAFGDHVRVDLRQIEQFIACTALRKELTQSKISDVAPIRSGQLVASPLPDLAAAPRGVGLSPLGGLAHDALALAALC